MLKPTRLAYFRSVTMVAAQWSQSIVAQAWQSAYRTTLAPLEHTWLLFDTHREKGPTLKIHYCLHPDDKATLDNLRRDHVTGEKSPHVASDRRVATHAAKAIEAFFAGRKLEYCWNANKEFRTLGHHLSGKQMPVVSAGLNEFEAYDNVAALACNNPPTWVKDLLIGFLGIAPTDKGAIDEMYRQWRFAQTYQSVGRCSLRNRDRKGENVVVVLSRQCAEDLSSLFPGSTIEGQIGDLPSLKAMDRAKKSETKPRYDRSDHKAWCVWRKRNPSEAIEKATWFATFRRYRKTTRLEGLAA